MAQLNLGTSLREPRSSPAPPVFWERIFLRQNLPGDGAESGGEKLLVTGKSQGQVTIRGVRFFSGFSLVEPSFSVVLIIYRFHLVVQGRNITHQVPLLVR